MYQTCWWLFKLTLLKSAGVSSKNNIKSIFTKTGSTITFDEGASSILVKDPSGNTWFMDGNGNINVTASKDITMNAGGNINMSAGKNISVNAGDNMSNIAGKDMSHIAGKDINQVASGDMRESTNNKTEIVENKFMRGSKNSKEFGEKVTIFSTKEDLHIESLEKSVHVNSTEKSNIF